MRARQFEKILIVVIALMAAMLLYISSEYDRMVKNYESQAMDHKQEISRLLYYIDDLKSPQDQEPLMTLDNDTLDLVARIIQQEAQGEGLAGKVAVANVLLNRVNDERFPNDLRSVITSRGQFESYETGRYLRVNVSRATYEALERALAGENIVPDAVYFCNYDLIGDRNREWFDTLKEVDQIGNHRFYR